MPYVMHYAMHFLMLDDLHQALAVMHHVMPYVMPDVMHFLMLDDLHQALAEAPLPHHHAAINVLHGARDDLRGARRVAVDE